MAKKNSYITVTDQFCGAGGSSQGVRAVAQRNKGLEVKLALNHWKLAIETHNTNFPDTIHDCTDISASEPRRYPSTDILITSPECTNHSLAKGKKRVKATLDLFASSKADAAAERSRATMWDVPRFAEYHDYRIIITENVVDAYKWILFESWLKTMHALGYNHRCVFLNSQFCHPTPQSRDRMYVVFWKKGNKAPNLDFTPTAWCAKCEKDVYAVQTWKRPDVRFGVYGKRGQYIYCCVSCSSIVQPYYYASFNCIDWSDIGTRIGDRDKPLSDNTVRRIQYGLDKYGAEPMTITQKYHGEDFKQSSRHILQPLRTQPSEQAHGVLTPFIIDDKQTTGTGFRVKSVADKLPTVHTDPRLKLVMPFIIKGEHTLKKSGYVTGINEPTLCQTNRQSMSLLTPFVIPMNSSGKAKPATEPTATFTGGGINHAMMAAPFIVNNNHSSKADDIRKPIGTQVASDRYGIITDESWNSFVASNYTTGHTTNHISEAIGAVNCKDRHAIISYQKPQLEDCFYRMLRPKEIKLAMAFEETYTVLGSGKDQVKQLGNAVTPPAMEFLIERCIESLK